MKPIWKRYSQEQRLCKEPKQEAIPQHWDDIEVRKIPAKRKGVRQPSGWNHLKPVGRKIPFSSTTSLPSQSRVLLFRKTWILQVFIFLRFPFKSWDWLSCWKKEAV
jgi:hypothetical protein